MYLMRNFCAKVICSYNSITGISSLSISRVCTKVPVPGPGIVPVPGPGIVPVRGPSIVPVRGPGIVSVPGPGIVPVPGPDFEPRTLPGLLGSDHS